LRAFSEGHSNLARPMRVDETMVSFVFAPIDEQALTETRKAYGLGVVPFMSGGDADNLGDTLFLLPGASQPDIVYIVCGGKPEYSVGQVFRPGERSEYRKVQRREIRKHEEPRVEGFHDAALRLLLRNSVRVLKFLWNDFRHETRDICVLNGVGHSREHRMTHEFLIPRVKITFFHGLNTQW
jgi:hypothetical protein